MIDFDFYINDYGGQKIEERDTFNEYASFAVDDINNLARGQLDDIDEMSSVTALLVKKAICIQIDYLFDNGIMQSSILSVGLGKFNYSANSVMCNHHFDNRAYSLLERAGLLYRGVSC